MKTVASTYNLQQIDSVASDILKQLESKGVVFNGDLGAGKTTLLIALLNPM
ncbi:MAG: hypothetical protein HRU49_14125 [Winogradskyella sp.]|uniref:hypothetical protein n=1 Tax=Winogradskyella sp. TaxID=1883156 RepID=UPI0025DDCDA2|nr:hypothetical protein [Winogradskyella sp.]NRB84889.1 hypothetical protein [Winogradskyella sp.]